MFAAASEKQEICGWAIVAAFLALRLYFRFAAGYAREDNSTFVTGRYYLRTSYIVIAVFSIVNVAVPRDAKGWGWAFVPMAAWLKWFGVALGFATVLLFWWVHKELGNNWHPYIVMKGETLLNTSGPFALARHPMYTVFLLFIVSMFLVSGFILPCVVLLLTWSWAASSIPAEERKLILKFGDDYVSYRRKVGAFFPWALPCDRLVVVLHDEAAKRTSIEDADYQELFG